MGLGDLLKILQITRGRSMTEETVFRFDIIIG